MSYIFIFNLIITYSRAYQQLIDEENKFINNNTQNNFYQANLDNYFNYILNNANNFCKFNCSSPLYFLTPFFSMRTYDNNIMYDNIQMQVNYNNYINNLNNINKIKNDKSYYSIDKNQDSNSSSHLSTTSDGGDQGNGNNNTYFSQEKKTCKDDKNTNELIEKSLKDMKDFYNSFESLGAVANLACFYYCNLEAEDSDFFVNAEITKLCENYDKIIENDSEREKEMKKYLL